MGQPVAVTIQGESASPDGRITRIALWVGAVAFVVRLVYLAQASRTALFWVPVLDERYYHDAALALFGESGGLDTFRPLLYPAFLAGIYRLAGEWGSVAAVVAQHLLGVATTVLVALLGTRVFRSAEAGLLAGLLYALAGPPLFFEGQLLTTSLFTFLAALQLWLLMRARTGWQFAAAGLVTGLAVQARPNHLLFVVLLGCLLILPGSRLERWFGGVGRRRLAAAVVAALAVHGAAALLHASVTGQVAWVTSSGGVNVYLGNKRGSDGMIPRQDFSVSAGERYRDSVQAFSEEGFRADRGLAADAPLDGGAVSRYWTRRALREVAAAPGEWATLMIRKATLLLWWREIPNNRSYGFAAREDTPLLSWMAVRWWLVLALALPGGYLAWRHGDRRGLAWCLAFAAMHALGVLLFFVNARYRLPLWPALAALGGGAAVAFLGRMGRRRRREARIAAALAALGLGLSLPNWTGTRLPGRERDLFFRSVARLEQGDLDGARDDAARSLTLEPGDAAAHVQKGNVALAQGRDGEALAAFREALRLDPGQPIAHANAGVALERLGRVEEAREAYDRALALPGDYPPAAVNAALLELRAGRLDRAEGLIGRAVAAGDSSVHLLAARFLLAKARGDAEAADLWAREVPPAGRETFDRIVGQ